MSEASCGRETIVWLLFFCGSWDLIGIFPLSRVDRHILSKCLENVVCVMFTIYLIEKAIFVTLTY